MAQTLQLLSNAEHPILKQAVGSTRKAMTDASYEVSDDFMPIQAIQEDGAAQQDDDTVAVVSLYELQNPTAADSNSANPGSLNLITDIKKVE